MSLKDKLLLIAASLAAVFHPDDLQEYAEEARYYAATFPSLPAVFRTIRRNLIKRFSFSTNPY